MPSVMELFGYKIYFWLNEGHPLEPVHVHVSKRPHKDATKIWLLKDGSVKVANSTDELRDKDLSRILKTIEIFSDKIKDAWLEKFGVITYVDDKASKHSQLKNIGGR